MNRELIDRAARVADAMIAAKPPQAATTTEHIIAAALPLIVHAVLDDVRRLATRSMAPAQIREMCNQIERNHQ